MKKNPLLELKSFGQSVWCDYIERQSLMSGDIKKMIEAGEIVGITSNPTIFEKAISSSPYYDYDILNHLERQHECDVDCLYETLITEDVRLAADLLRPIYELTNGVDGLVSIEVSPRLAHDSDATIAEARRLFSILDRPNILIKVPATPEGLPAITTLIGAGINVNVTLMFSVEQYMDVSAAYLAGLEELAANGGDLNRVSSVASFFVSRIDTAVDKLLPAASPLRGMIAIANARVAYARFREVFRSNRFAALKERGARVQRVLWASTSVKDPKYRDVRYVEGLIGPDTVNTMPPVTLDAFRDHGQPHLSLTDECLDAVHQIGQLKEMGIDFDAVTRQLTEEGVILFRRSYDSLLAALQEKCSMVGHTI